MTRDGRGASGARPGLRRSGSCSMSTGRLGSSDRDVNVGTISRHRGRTVPRAWVATGRRMYRPGHCECAPGYVPERRSSIRPDSIKCGRGHGAHFRHSQRSRISFTCASVRHSAQNTRRFVLRPASTGGMSILPKPQSDGDRSRTVCPRMQHEYPGSPGMAAAGCDVVVSRAAIRATLHGQGCPYRRVFPYKWSARIDAESWPRVVVT